MMGQKLFYLNLLFLIGLFFSGSILHSAESGSPNNQKVLYVFALESYLEQKPDNKSWQYDVINLVTALQGLVNRDSPQLYILYIHEGLSLHQKNVDKFWLEKLRSPGNYLSDYTLINVETLEELLQIFRSYYSAVVLWDPEVPATGNVALTIAGVDGFLPVRHDPSPESLFTQIVTNGPQLNPGERLTGKFSGVGNIYDTNRPSTQIPKEDAYLWAKIFYLDTGMCSQTYLGYFLDPFDWGPTVPGFQYPDLYHCQIVNHDFYVSQRSFFVDLDPWWDEIPTDTQDKTLNSGKDKEVLTEILMSAFENTRPGERILRVGGVVPWWKKYSSYQAVNTEVKGKHPPNETAREFISIISAYNGIIDGDNFPFGALANASVYQHIPLKNRYFQNPVPPQRALENKNYLLFVIGDFRSSAMLYQTIPVQWEDMARGLIPITWSLSPLLSERVPHIFEYIYSTRTSNDYFAAGNTGPGLCYPNRYIPNRVHSRLGNGLPFWQALAIDFYEQFDLHMTMAADLDREQYSMSLVPGETQPESAIFDEQLQDLFFLFSPHGVSALKPYYEPLGKQIVPFIHETHNFEQRLLPLDDVAATIYENSSENERSFQVYRFNLTTPKDLVYLSEKIKRERPGLRFELLDPYSFFYLLRQHYANGDPSVNYLLPNYISNTIPREIRPGNAQECQVVLRNDGWDIWNPIGVNPKNRHQLTYYWVYEDNTNPIPGKHEAYVNGPVLPGQQTTMNILIEAPQKEGLYKLILNFEKEDRISALEEHIRVVVENPPETR